MWKYSSSDAFPARSFELMIANPPFGVDWRKIERQIRREANDLGSAGRFGAGLPRVSDGSLLFLQHLISKMRTKSDGVQGLQYFSVGRHCSLVLPVLENQEFDSGYLPTIYSKGS